jgi:hypothetical protein
MTIRFLRALIGALVLAFVSAGTRRAIAQTPETSGFIGVTFASASANEDGYVHANLTVDYSFRLCSGTIHLVYGVRPGSVNGFPTYWYKGHNYGTPPGTQPPNAPFLTTELRVRFGAEEVYSAVKRDPSVTTNVSCSGNQWIGLGSVSKYDRDAKTPREIQDVLNRFTFDIGVTRDPLRSPSVESALAREMVAAAQKARRDSTDKVTKARQDSIRSARATTSTTVRGSSGSATNSTATAASVRQSGSAAAGGGSSAAQRPQQDADAKARTDAAERQRQAQAVSQMLADRQAAEEARTEQVNQAAAQLGDLVGGIMRERAAEAERREAREAEARRRKEEYQLRKRAEYLAAPERPRCTDADVTETLTLDQKKDGALTLSNCRLADSTSAVVYDFVLDRPRAITLTLAPSGFYGRMQLAAGNLVIGNGDAITPIERPLTPGTYRVTVSSEALGETGSFQVLAHRSVLSKTYGMSYAFVAGMTSTPFAGRDGMMQEGGLRLGLGVGPYVTLLVQGGTGDNSEAGVDKTFVEYGGRVYLGNIYSAWRPFGQYMMGTHKFDLWQSVSIDHYQGSGSSFGGGVEWFLARRLAAEFGVYQSTGSMTREGSAGSVSLAATHFGLGFTFHQ